MVHIAQSSQSYCTILWFSNFGVRKIVENRKKNAVLPWTPVIRFTRALTVKAQFWNFWNTSHLSQREKYLRTSPIKQRIYRHWKSRDETNSNDLSYCLPALNLLLRKSWVVEAFFIIEARSHDAICIMRFFCSIILKPKRWFTNQWIRQELCTTNRIVWTDLKWGNQSQVVLAGTLTGVQGDIRCKVLAALSTAK